jgi:hypothetical protein
MQRRVDNSEEFSYCEEFSDFRSLTFSPGLKIIDIRKNKFKGYKFPKLPQGLEQFYFDCCTFSGPLELPDSLVSLSCDYNTREYFSDLPRGLKELHYIGNLSRFNLPSGLEVLIGEGPDILNIADLPRGLTVLKLNYLELTCEPGGAGIGQLFPNLVYLELNYTGHIEFGELPESLIYFAIDGGMNKLPKLPKNLEVLDVGTCCGIKVLGDLPEGLRVLDISFSEIESVGKFPAGLVKFDCHYSSIRSLARIPDGLEIFIAHGTPLAGRLELPGTIRYLDCGSTKVDEIVWRGDVVPDKIVVFDCGQ